MIITKFWINIFNFPHQCSVLFWNKNIREYWFQMNLLWNLSKQMVSYILLKEETHYKINNFIIITHIFHFARIFFFTAKTKQKVVLMWGNNLSDNVMVQCTTNIHYIGAIHKWRHPLTGEGGYWKGDITP